MSQRDLFALPLCPCGTAPVVRDWHESPDVVTWCQCDPMIFDTPTDYEGWLASLPNQQEQTNA